jgi:hypothetical protein
MPLLSIDYIFNKSALHAVLGYAIINISGRPDDNYVKQIGINKGIDWKVYGPDESSNFKSSFAYVYKLNKLDLTLQYAVSYDAIDGPRGYKSLQRMLLAGVKITR